MSKKSIPWNKGKTKYKPKLCLCGCGQYTKVGKCKNGSSYIYWENSWIKGHEKRGINGFNRPAPRPKLCACGCGQYANVLKWKRESGSYKYYVATWIRGHAKRGINGYNPDIHEPRKCACGCGQTTKKTRGKYNKYIKGHCGFKKGYIPWNTGRKFSESVRIKMSLAKRGVSPANKVNVDINEIRRLYVQEKKTCSEISKILGCTKDVIKNRIRGQRWVRTTKESCSLKSFRDKMRILRVKAMACSKRGQRTSLEIIFYKILDRAKIKYLSQHPMYNKFVVDAFLPRHNLVVEAMGKYWHNLPNVKKKDRSKKAYLEKCGCRVLELWEDEILKCPEECINKIKKEISFNTQ